MGKNMIKGARSALRVRKMIKAWKAENEAFIEETARRGAHYLRPAQRTPAGTVV